MAVKGVRKSKERKKKKDIGNTLFALKDALMTKNYNYWDSNPRSEKDFSFYAMIQMFSYDNSYCELVEMINKVALTNTLTKKQQYDMLMEIIPKGKVFAKSPKGKAGGGKTKDDYIIKIAEYFEVSLREARQYIILMGVEWAKDILNRFGGKIK